MKVGPNSKKLPADHETADHIGLHSSAGFSLVEMMVAILLLVVGVLAALSMISVAIDSNRKGNRLSVKTALGQQVMEELLSRKVDNPAITTTASNAYDLNGVNTAGNDITIQGGGTFRAAFDTTIDAPVTGVTTIRITITSVPEDGNPLTLTCYKRVQ